MIEQYEQTLKLDISNVVSERLEFLREHTKAQDTIDVFASALAVYYHLIGQKIENDAEVILRYKDGSEKRVAME